MTSFPVDVRRDHHGQVSAQFSAELSRLAHAEGANVGLWPGLTIHRFTRATKPRWHEIRRLSLCIVARPGGALAAASGDGPHAQNCYCVVGSGRDFDCQILDASFRRPILCVVLELDPRHVRSVLAGMGGVSMPLPPDRDDYGLSVPGVELMDAASRFLRSLATSRDRRILAPLHLQEMVYWLLEGEQRLRLAQLAAYQAEANPVGVVLDYIADHFAERLTVEILAKQVSLSPSAFSRLFRETTRCSPYQYVKETRLERARQLFDEGRPGVADVSRTVGYTSVSHFIKGFRKRFGATPGEYVDMCGLRSRVRTVS
jgi:AraC-like DNA-binding protein